MINAIKSFFTKSTNYFFILLSLLLAINSLYFLSSQGSFLPSIHTEIPKGFFYFIYITITAGGFLFILSEKTPLNFNFLASIFLLAYFPSEAVFIYALQNNFYLTPYVGLFAAIYIALLTCLVVRFNLEKDSSQDELFEKKPGRDYFSIAIVTLVMLLSFSFGLFHLGKLAVVDEPLWTFDRIPNFWKDLGEKDWRNANVSDKPGLPVAVISGAGMLVENSPKNFKRIIANKENPNLNAGKMDSFNIAFRLPILIFVIAMLPVFYLFIKRLAGRTSALFSLIFIALSPIMIGNSRIINPDSILWIFTSLSLIAFLLYLKDDRRSDLMFSGFFLGLSLLTKYTGNILYFFFLALIFGEYIFNYPRHEKTDFARYFRKHFSNYFLLVFISFATFFVLYPAAWGKPMRLLNSTIFSQAVEPVWPAFASVLFLLFCDLAFFKNIITKTIVHFFIPLRKYLYYSFAGAFLLLTAAVFINVYSGMSFFDFQDILSSPKSSFAKSTVFAFFAANFYPLLFGVSAISLVSLVFFLLLSLKKKVFSDENSLAIFYLVLFVLAYYLGSVAAHVASIIRYQIIVFPIFFIAAAIALRELLRFFLVRKWLGRIRPSVASRSLSIILIMLSVFCLWQIKPFYMGYASFLLPERYYLDVKDMGEGSYEAAQYLNSLPDAKKLSIWTDKQGVCIFFVGRCYTTITPKFFLETKLDYLVASSGRKSRTTKLRGDLLFHNTSFKDIYETDEFEKLIVIGNRKNNNVKIIKADAIGN